MQVLFRSSAESPSSQGLAIIPDDIGLFSSADKSVPHMGWNDVKPLPDAPLFKGLEQDARFYFLHSYFFECRDAAHAAAHAEYGLSFTASVRKGCIYGMQAHPEKSHHWGAALLKNFAELES